MNFYSLELSSLEENEVKLVVRENIESIDELFNCIRFFDTHTYSKELEEYYNPRKFFTSYPYLDEVLLSLPKEVYSSGNGGLFTLLVFKNETVRDLKETIKLLSELPLIVEKSAEKYLYHNSKTNIVEFVEYGMYCELVKSVIDNNKYSKFPEEYLRNALSLYITYFVSKHISD